MTRYLAQLFALLHVLKSFATVAFLPSGPPLLETSSKTQPRIAPANSVNCGAQSTQASWNAGVVFVDTVNLNTNAKRAIAAGWCVYLAVAEFREPVASFARWTEAQMSVELKTDLGIEWAKANWGNSRIRFRVSKADASVAETYLLTTTIEEFADSIWRERAVHTVKANYLRDTARFESLLTPRLAGSASWSTPTIRFHRLDSGSIDTARARGASDFISRIRQRVGISNSNEESARFIFTQSGNGKELLGFSRFEVPIDGFTSRQPLLVFSNDSQAGELYWHELVHVALAEHRPRIPNALEESLALALGGTAHRTWLEFVCQERSLILDREAIPDVTSLLLKPDSALKASSTIQWELAFLIEYTQFKRGDAGLRQLLSNPSPLIYSRSRSREHIAHILGVDVATLIREVGSRNSATGLSSRC